MANDPARLDKLRQHLNLISSIDQQKEKKRKAKVVAASDTGTVAKRAKYNDVKKQEFYLWQALSAAGSMLDGKRAAQFKPPQMQELRNYIAIKGLDLSSGKKTRADLLGIVRGHVGETPASAGARDGPGGGMDDAASDDSDESYYDPEEELDDIDDDAS